MNAPAPAREPIKIDALTTLVFEAVGNQVLLTVTVAGMQVFQRAVGYNIANLLGSTAKRHAEQAAENELLA